MTTTITLPMTKLERFWASTVLPSFAGASFAEASSAGATPGFSVSDGEVDYLAGLARFMGAASEKAKLGIRLAFFLAVTTPLWIGGRFRGFSTLSPNERSELLDAMSRHRVFLVRELCLLLKLIACMAIFRAPGTRERTGYDGEPRTRALRGRRALPLLAGAAGEPPISGDRAIDANDSELAREGERAA